MLFKNILDKSTYIININFLIIKRYNIIIIQIDTLKKIGFYMREINKKNYIYFFKIYKLIIRNRVRIYYAFVLTYLKISINNLF